MIKKLLILSAIISCSLIYSQNVNIPDANFKAYLIGNSDINTNGDTEIQLSEANNFTGFIDCSFQNISDLTGIESFIKITQLICNDNQLTTLDTSKNIALTSLECGNNQLATLVVSSNIALNVINCYGNQLTNIDVSKNVELDTFDCSNNRLTSLDVSKNTALLFLGCYQNQIESLDLSKNIALTEILCSNNKLVSLNIKNGQNTNISVIDTKQNPNLNCIQVDDAEYSNLNWIEKDSWSVYSTSCDNLSAMEIEKDKVKIYPNPVKDVLNIQTINKFEKLEIYSSTGQLIRTSFLKNSNVFTLPKGNYVVKIMTDKGIITEKIIKD